MSSPENITPRKAENIKIQENRTALSNIRRRLIPIGLAAILGISPSVSLSSVQSNHKELPSGASTTPVDVITSVQIKLIPLAKPRDDKSEFIPLAKPENIKLIHQT